MIFSCIILFVTQKLLKRELNVQRINYIMNQFDKIYLSMQFKLKVFQKNATEYESFFQEIMEKAFEGFQKIRPYGNEGDSGNDGYISSKGIYYQVYAPSEPDEKEAATAKKYKDDFEKAKKDWNKISPIKAYYFVFNDKYKGISIKLESAKSELKNDNPKIEFDIFLPKHLETTFFTLKEEDIISLGFDVDSRKSKHTSQKYLEMLETDLDRGNLDFISKNLEIIKSIIISLKDESLLLDFEILEARTFQKLELIPEALENFNNIHKKYPDDCRAPLYMAAIYLNDNNIEKYQELIKKAEQIDEGYWMLKIQKLIREFRLGNTIDESQIDEKSFPSKNKIKAEFYRIYSLFLMLSNNYTRAESFLERSLALNPDNFSTYSNKLSLLKAKLIKQDNYRNEPQQLTEFLNEVETVEKTFLKLGGLGPRNLIQINVNKLFIFLSQDNYPNVERTAKDTFELALKCHFDLYIDSVLTEIVRFIDLPDDEFRRLLNYLHQSEMQISESLAKYLTLQFMQNETLFTEGLEYFKANGIINLQKFINNLKDNKEKEALLYIMEDKMFAVNFSVQAKSHPELRRKIINNLPDDGKIQKDMFYLLFYHEEGKIDDAFEILQNLDLSDLRYSDCMLTLKIAEEKKAWDIVLTILEKLLPYETRTNEILKIKLQQFNANLHLEIFPEVINIGEDILSDTSKVELLDDYNREALIINIIYSCDRRGDYPKAKHLVEKYSEFFKTYEAKLTVANVYLKNKDPENALRSVVEAIKILKRPSPEEYGNLFQIFMDIGNLSDFNLEPLEQVEPNTFVKIKDIDRWYFIGDKDDLDAIKVPSDKQAGFLDKRLGEKIVFGSDYSSEHSEHEIENILTLDKYIHWQCIHNAQKLTFEGIWNKMEAIEITTTEEGIDTQHLIARLEDQYKIGKEFFDLYCNQNVPLAFLAVSEGSLTNAIGRIVTERRGFIKVNKGSINDRNSQNDLARQIISGNPFYIDGTSTLFLAETGLLEKIYEFLPNIKVPQSVISLMLEVKEIFREHPGQVGQMFYSHGEISISSVNTDKRAVLQNNIDKSIEILESNSNNIEVISSANKSDTFSEQKVPPSLCDACILAQRDCLPIMTEDFHYLQANEFETKKKAPSYCSSLALVRVLYEDNKISFKEYINYFSYLASYRVSFLSISLEDLEKAVFGDAIIDVVNIEELEKFNFALTLSKEYGVPSRDASLLVGKFVLKLIIDDSVQPDVVEQIFRTIVSSFPTTQNRKFFARALLISFVNTINNIQDQINMGKRVDEKIDLLYQSIEMYDSSGILIL